MPSAVARRAAANEPSPARANDPFLQGFYAPEHFEHDVHDLKVDGELPKTLIGTLYRNGPNPQFPPRGPYHWFDADGMIHAFHIENGRVSYRNRWVRTPRWLAEHVAGKSLFGGFTNPGLSDPRAADIDSGTANTNIVWHARRLMALQEGSPPFLIDPASLDTKGTETYGGRAPGPFTAHPRIDAQTGELIFFGYAAKGPHTPFVSLHVADKNGTITRSEMLQIPFAAMIHDFVVTKNWIVVPVFPLTDSLERTRSGLPPFAWEPDRGTHIAFVPRNGSVDGVRWATLPACYVYHFMNHYDAADGKVVMDAMKYAVAPLFPLPDGSPSSKTEPTATLFRWTFDLAGRDIGFKEQQLDDLAGEFPRFDDRVCMADYRHGWTLAFNGPELTQNGLVHHDLKAGKRTVWKAGSRDGLSEPVFVPRAADAAEGDGWILAAIYRGSEERSDLCVFEATDIAKGPIALAHLSSRVPAGFHGNWRPGAL